MKRYSKCENCGSGFVPIHGLQKYCNSACRIQYNIKRCSQQRKLAGINIADRRYTCKKYGITLDDYNKMFKKQQGCCFICGRPQSELKYYLAIDHDHITGKVRGLLCNNCNAFVGWFENNYRKFYEYRKKYNIKTC